MTTMVQEKVKEGTVKDIKYATMLNEKIAQGVVKQTVVTIASRSSVQGTRPIGS